MVHAWLAGMPRQCEPRARFGSDRCFSFHTLRSFGSIPSAAMDNWRFPRLRFSRDEAKASMVLWERAALRRFTVQRCVLARYPSILRQYNTALAVFLKRFSP